MAKNRDVTLCGAADLWDAPVRPIGMSRVMLGRLLYFSTYLQKPPNAALDRSEPESYMHNNNNNNNMYM